MFFIPVYFILKQAVDVWDLLLLVMENLGMWQNSIAVDIKVQTYRITPDDDTMRGYPLEKALNIYVNSENELLVQIQFSPQN